MGGSWVEFKVHGQEDGNDRRGAGGGRDRARQGDGRRGQVAHQAGDPEGDGVPDDRQPVPPEGRQPGGGRARPVRGGRRHHFLGRNRLRKARVRTVVLPRGTPSSPKARREWVGSGRLGDGRNESGLKLHFAPERVRTVVLPRGTPSSPKARREWVGSGRLGDGRNESGLKLRFAPA